MSNPENIVHGNPDLTIPSSYLSTRSLGYMLTMNDLELATEYRNAVSYYGNDHEYTKELATTMQERGLPCGIQ